MDYALLSAEGELLGNPRHYRDARTDGVPEQVDALLGPAELYQRTGVQRMPINTVYQWVAAREASQIGVPAHALLVADLITYWLTGTLATELTNASTTGLLDVRERDWSEPCLPRWTCAPTCSRGSVDRAQGSVRFRRPWPTNWESLELRSPRSGHMTPPQLWLEYPPRDEHFAYISCGTWSLVGVEIAEPITTDAARAANFSNELGVDGTVRFLRNVMGLWLLQESVRAWEAAGSPVDLAQLIEDAGTLQAGSSVIDPDRPEFLVPNDGVSGDMPARIARECARVGQPMPATPAEADTLHHR